MDTVTDTQHLVSIVAGPAVFDPGRFRVSQDSTSFTDVITGEGTSSFASQALTSSQTV
ncbi:hypothetical protein BAUCODRAFT_38585 [Baudoinia panamericana UAMH 10762]|uniref:Uncharacterized protein n=1 Tax=Baudoinia panamericana (strain UAMH 10762) TaxID=717646 RepID=M2M854_BAUPA|nr:uncharacterized protein BAUCODRAFT_38585 [Baudoinia panamericana UAMH 10762]EMC92521.1 hypothetical protein BAUCODRAFT_38585 [Baudoinia panamericana UAMH 10762]